MSRPARLGALAAALSVACRGSSGPVGSAEGGAQPAEAQAAATPVEVAPVRRATLSVRVSAPGNTVALQVQSVRAPFAGTLLDLGVQDGDHVRAGQVLGHLMSRESVAALEGARALARSASSPQERSDAERALAVAKQGQVAAALRAPGAGLVVSHQANDGALVAQDQEILTLAATDALSFIARIAQSDLPRIRAGQIATVELPARGATLRGVVHSVLAATTPGAPNNPNDPGAYSAPVRIDFAGAGPGAPGLFGTAHIVVAEHSNAQAVPAAALLRDDITGTTRLATVAQEKAHWVDVKVGIEGDGLVEVLSPGLPVGAGVLTRGMVGLAEGAPVRVQK